MTPQQFKMGQEPDGIGFWMPHSIPAELLDFFLQGGGGLIGGQIMPEDYLEGMQMGWEKCIADGQIPR